MVTIKEAARRLKRHPDTLRGWVEAGLLTPAAGGGRGRPMLFDVAELARVEAPRKGAPVRGTLSDPKWERAGRQCLEELDRLPEALRREFGERLSREIQIVFLDRPRPGGPSGAVSAIRDLSPDADRSDAFNLIVLKAHVVRELMGLSHARTAEVLGVSTTTLYGFLELWEGIFERGTLPAQPGDSTTDDAPAGPVAIPPEELERIRRLPPDRQGDAYLKVAAKADAAAVRRTGRQARTLSGVEQRIVKRREVFTDPHVLEDPGGSESASADERRVARAYAAPDEDLVDYGDESDDDIEYPEDDVEELTPEEEAALELADAASEEYASLSSHLGGGRPVPLCLCSAATELTGPDADAYAVEHLTYVARADDEVGTYACPETGIQWQQDWPYAGRRSWGDTRLLRRE